MHGTGTSLGDPIEFGASLAALGRDDGAPLTLEAVVLRRTHRVRERRRGARATRRATEPRVLVASAAPVRVNPHVAGVLDTARMSAGGARLLARVCRQDAAAASRRVERSRRGVGSFAFQGTNGQAILAAHRRRREVRAPFRRARRVPSLRSSAILGVTSAARVLRAFASARERTSGGTAWRRPSRARTRAITASWDARCSPARVSSRRRSRERCTRSRWTSPRPPTWCCWSVRSPCPWCSRPFVAPRRLVVRDEEKIERREIDETRDVVGLEWRAERGSATVEIASLGGFAASRTPAHLRRASRCSRKGRERTRNPRPTDPNRLRRTRSSAAAANERRRDRSEPSPRASTTSTSGTSSTPRAWITPCSSAPRSRSRRRRHPRVRFRNRR